MEPLTTLAGQAIALPIDNIDTDQIIPARYLKTTSREGLGQALFADWRYLADGGPNPAFALNQPQAAGATILVVGGNFGCGSSREHAVWALAQFGFRVVVSTSFADIFRQNALKNALLPVVLEADDHRMLLDATAKAGLVELGVDLERQALTLPDGREVSFPIDSFAKSCLVHGVDEIGYVLQREAEIAAYEQHRKAAGTRGWAEGR